MLLGGELLTLGLLTKDNQNNKIDINKPKIENIDINYIKRFNNINKNNYMEKIYSKSDENFKKSLSPNTNLINREWRTDNQNYYLDINNKIKTEINNNLSNFEKKNNNDNYIENMKNSNDYESNSDSNFSSDGSTLGDTLNKNNFVKRQDNLKTRIEVDMEKPDYPISETNGQNFCNSFSSQYEPMKFGYQKTPRTSNYYDEKNKMFNTTHYTNNDNLYSKFDPRTDGRYGVVSDMTHNNMMPFYKGKSYGYNPEFDRKQLEKSTRNVELMTGSDQMLEFKHKQEVKALFDPVVNKVDSVTGTPNFNDYFQSRIIPSDKRQGEKPFQPVLVGPGLNLGYNQVGHQGVKGIGDPYRILPKNVDQLRTVDNPKVSYTPPVIPGQKGDRRGVIGDVNKNHIERFYQNLPENMMPTSSIEHAPALYGEINLKETQRINENNYIANAGNNKKMNYFINPNNLIPNETERGTQNENLLNISNSLKSYLYNSINSIPDETLRSIISNNVHIMNISGNQLKNINFNYENGRPNTTLKELLENNVTMGNLTGHEQGYLFNNINSIPDTTLRELINTSIVKGGLNFTGNHSQGVNFNYENNISGTTLKELLENNTHINNYVGNHSQNNLFNYQNNIPNTTIKELNENNKHINNYTGNHSQNNLFNYQNNIPNTTLKELNENNKHINNYAGNHSQNNLFNYENNIPNTTMKELFENTKHINNYTGNHFQNQLNNYTPPDTTIKELSENNKNLLNIIGNYGQGNMYNYDNNIKTTLKELLENSKHLLNVGGSILQNQMFNYDPPTKNTLRQLIEETKHLTGIGSTILTQGKLFNFNDIPDTTLRETTENTKNITGTKGNSNNPFLFNYENNIPNTTLRETTENTKNIIGTKSIKQQGRSRSDANNALLNTQKEILFKRRAPTVSGVNKGYNNTMTEYSFKNDNNSTLSNLTRNSTVKSNIYIPNPFVN